MSRLGTAAASLGGRTLGNAIIPGIGGVVGGIAAGALARRLFGGGGQQAAPSARDRYRALAEQMAGRAAQDPTETAGYRAQVSGARDAMREDAQGDAARAGALGLSPGMATAAGAGSRARALAGVQRQAVAGAEGQQARLQGLAAQLAGGAAQMEMADEDRSDRRRRDWTGTIGNLGMMAAEGYFRQRPSPAAKKV